MIKYPTPLLFTDTLTNTVEWKVVECVFVCVWEREKERERESERDNVMMTSNAIVYTAQGHTEAQRIKLALMEK